MNDEVDLRQLAIDRGGTTGPGLRTRRHVLTRYVIPLGIVCGFLLLVAWSLRDVVFPPRSVTVAPVFSTTALARQEGTPLFQAAGWIEPRPTPVRVAALAPGVVEELLVVEDQAVEKGGPVAELVKADSQLVLDRSEADLELRQAELDAARAVLQAAVTRLEQPAHLQAPLGEAEAALAKIDTESTNLPFRTRRAVADLEAVVKDYEGKRAAKGVVAGVAIDISRSKVESLRALVEELRDRANSLEKERRALIQRRDALKTQLDLLADEIEAKKQAEAGLRAATARVARARVVVSQAKLQLDRMTVRSPVDGRVFRLVAEPGSRIGSGMTQMAGHDGSTIVTLYRPNMLQIRVDVRFEDVPSVSLEQTVKIDNAALESPIAGRVLFVSSEADIQKNTLQVKVEILDPPPVFKPEMLVDVTFLAPKQTSNTTEPSSRARIYVLKQLIHEDAGGSFVWLADQSKRVVRKKAVQTGEVGSNGLVEITSGLTVASRIISSGSDGLRDGDRIRVNREGSSLDASPSPSGGPANSSPGRRPTESEN